MSFTFQWPRFSDQFHTDAIQMLNNALNKGNKPPVIADKIEVPPELEIRDIGDLTMDQFRGIFRLTYAGDAYLVLKTKVQANPLNHKQPDIHLMTGSRGMLAAKEPLVVPMLLRLSHFKLNSYVVLVVSKQKGITLVFKTDPLQNVDINSTFDSIAVIQNFIKQEIEGSTPSNVQGGSANYHPSPEPAVGQGEGGSTVSRQTTTAGGACAIWHEAGSSPPPTESTSSFPELENFDPTYGLRPEGLPPKSAFSNFGRLFKQNRGLADLAEEQSDVDETEGVAEEEDRRTYSVVDSVTDWEETSTDYSPPPSVMPDDSVTMYMTPTRIPLAYRPTSSYNPYFPPFPQAAYHSPDSLETRSSLSTSSGFARSVETPPSDPPHSTHSHESIHKLPPQSLRRLSMSSSATANLDPFHSGSPPPHYTLSETDPKIILRPALNSTLHQLSTLSSSNHTLSPYTRSLEHFAVRSGPPRALNASGVRPPPERRPVKAKRKRTYRISGKSQSHPEQAPTPDSEDAKERPPARTSTSSPIPPSEFDASEMERYFRVGDDDPDGVVVIEGPSGQYGRRQQLYTFDTPLPPGSFPRYPNSRDAYEPLRKRRP
ncbi:hypothetical protein JVU11DRAFT_2015 [Chiua virens]|nr:hypothetical protein JVU11DRAFT_2015 [Chiua virens]